MGPAEKLSVLCAYFGSIALKSGLKRCFGEICLRGWIPFGWIHGRPRLQGWGVPGGGFFLIKGLEFIDPPLTQLRTPPHRTLITTDFGKLWFQCLNFEHKEITGLCTSETFFWGEILHNKSHFWGGFQRPRPDGTYDGRTHICVMLRSRGAYGGPSDRSLESQDQVAISRGKRPCHIILGASSHHCPTNVPPAH